MIEIIKENSEVKITAQDAERSRGHIKATNSKIEILNLRPDSSLKIDADAESEVIIDSNSLIRNLFIYARNAKIKIGKNSSMNGPIRIMAHEKSSIIIGQDCLMAGEIEITSSDMHSIIDVSSKKRINQAKDIFIGNKVWIGQRAMILKGSIVLDGAIIGAGSVLSGLVDENSIAAGNPAKIIKHNVTWLHELI